VTNPLPVLQGAPDFLPQLASSNIQIIRKSESIAALTTYPIVYVGNTPFMYIRISAAVAMNLGIAFFADLAGTQSLFGDVVSTRAFAADAMVCIPVRGPYVKFTVEREAYPGTINLDAFAVPSRFNVYSGTDGENALISQQNVVLGAGANITFQANTVRSGRAFWTADLRNAGTFICYLYAVNFLGVTTLLDYIDAPSRQRNRSVILPALPVQIQMFNLSAGPFEAFATLHHHNFDY
jgi:hypothetical protein